MKKTNWKYRFIIWWAQRVLHVPFIVNFTPEDHDDLYAVAFAWTPGAADRVRGNDMLIERAQRAESLAKANLMSRSGRRAINRAAKREARK
jgi:hypothetical protein